MSRAAIAHDLGCPPQYGRRPFCAAHGQVGSGTQLTINSVPLHLKDITASGCTHGFVLRLPGTGKTYAMSAKSLLVLEAVFDEDERVLWVSSNNTALDGAGSFLESVQDSDSTLAHQIAHLSSKSYLKRLWGQ